MNEKQKAKAFDLLCEQLNEMIDKRIPDWLSDNPYWDCGDGHYPATTTSDAIDGICDEILKGAEDLGLYDFFELALNEVCNTSIGKNNSYVEKIKEV